MRVVILVMAATMAGCGAGSVKSAARSVDDPSQPQDVSAAPKYLATLDYIDQTNVDLEGAWYDLQSGLANSFGQVCGDTFCDGDYGNVTSLAMTCSVEVKTGNIHLCQWTFAGSYDEVYKSSGNISTHAVIWKCPLAVSGITPQAFITLETDPSNPEDMLHRTIPGANQTLYDMIAGCLP